MERRIRVQAINGKHKILCPRSGEFEYLNEQSFINSKQVFHCSSCEHYKFSPSAKYLSELTMEQEYLPAETSHIVCDYPGEVHRDWKELGLDPGWGLTHPGISEEERVRVIEESGSEPVPQSELSERHSQYYSDDEEEQEVIRREIDVEPGQQTRMF